MCVHMRKTVQTLFFREFNLIHILLIPIFIKTIFVKRFFTNLAQLKQLRFVRNNCYTPVVRVVREALAIWLAHRHPRFKLLHYVTGTLFTVPIYHHTCNDGVAFVKPISTYGDDRRRVERSSLEGSSMRTRVRAHPLLKIPRQVIQEFIALPHFNVITRGDCHE